MEKVLLIDSGSGGINILKECVKVAPYCDYLLYCDNKNLPYGNKTKEQLLQITFKNLENIYKFFKFKIVIFACNTLTCTCLQECRDKFKNIIFIGTVPAVKPALEKFDEKDILVLATKTTLEHNQLIKSHKNLQTLYLPTLAKDIDKNLSNLNLLKPKLKKILLGYTAKAVVLGCTHYKAVEKQIKSILGNVQVFDSENGVARRLESFLLEKKINYQVQIMLSGDGEGFLPILWDYYSK